MYTYVVRKNPRVERVVAAGGRYHPATYIDHVAVRLVYIPKLSNVLIRLRAGLPLCPNDIGIDPRLRCSGTSTMSENMMD